MAVAKRASLARCFPLLLAQSSVSTSQLLVPGVGVKVAGLRGRGELFKALLSRLQDAAPSLVLFQRSHRRRRALVLVGCSLPLPLPFSFAVASSSFEPQEASLVRREQRCRLLGRRRHGGSRALHLPAPALALVVSVLRVCPYLDLLLTVERPALHRELPDLGGVVHADLRLLGVEPGAPEDVAVATSAPHGYRHFIPALG